ncbi:hypothetical protein ACHAXA_001645 [Cyclostephanos tholiformis]|uniref:Kinesin motor domain-containing protein n=1 Tax=Cyclostephanos tholiformis TaxID=382380 RepID=A0ABD3RVC7_9STRA
MSSFDASSIASSSSSSAAHPANIRVLVRVRPLNENESRIGRGGGVGKDGIIEIDDSDMKSTIDFGCGGLAGGSSPEGVGGGGGGSRGRVVVVDQVGGGVGGGYGSGCDGGTNPVPAAQQQQQQRSFTYDAVYGPSSSQGQIFDAVKGIIDAVCDGYNGTIVAYGQTGSGKTHTIFGGGNDDDDAGLVQRALTSIFDKISGGTAAVATDRGTAPAATGGGCRTTTKASFFEIYNERVYDLLSLNNDGPSMEDDRGLPVREDNVKGVYVEGLYEWEVNNTNDAMQALRMGMANRSVASTNMNRASSRSHAIFVLSVRSVTSDGNSGGIARVRHSKFTLVDLAGSERQKTTATDGERLKEASMINGSLLVLGKVINSLVDRERGGRGRGPNRQQQHVQFRDSKLTFLLRDSFGGNSKTCLVATVSPSVSSLSETISTLTFAQRAKLITNTAVLNENTSGSVSALQAEIVRLRAELERQRDDGPIIIAQPQNDGGDRLAGVVDDQGLLASSSAAKPALVVDVVAVNALRDQNAKLNKKVKVLGDVMNRREVQVGLLKRKLQQETLIRKCKERRITYYQSNKCGISGMDEEIQALREEVVILRDQLNATPSESIEWMIKYKETKARVEELENGAIDTFESDEKFELQASLVSLLNERDALQQKVQSMSDERNLEIDNIIKDVNMLEDSNVMLQSRLDEKEFIINSNVENMRMHEAQIDALREEVTAKVTSLESMQIDLLTEKRKTAELQETVESIKIEAEKANIALFEQQTKLTAAEEEIAKMVERHNESTIELNKKLGEMQDEVAGAMNENGLLVDKLKQASSDLRYAKNQLETLEHVKNDALTQLELYKGKSDSDSESFKLQEENLRAEIKTLEATVESLLAETSHGAANLESLAASNTVLLDEVETLKLERDALQRRVASLDKLHDHAAMLEDEVAFFRIEVERTEDRIQSNEADHDRTIRLQQHVFDAQTAAHIDELALRDESIDLLSREKFDMQEKLAKVTRQLSQVTEASEEKIALVENYTSELLKKIACLEADAKTAYETIESLQKSEAQIAQQLEQRNDLEETLNAKITELQADLDAALSNTVSLSDQLKAATHSISLAEKVEATLKSEFCDLRERAASFHKIRDEVDTLEDEVEFASIAKSHVDAQLQFALYDLDRTGRLLNRRDDDLADQDEIIARILAEKEILHKDATHLSKQLESKDAELSLTIKVQAKLESELNASTSREEYLKATIEALKEEKASGEALMTEKIDLLEKENSALRYKHSDDVNTLEDEVEFASIAKSHVDAQLQFALYDLDRTGRLLNRRDDDLADQDEIIARILAEKEILHKDATHLSKQLESKDAELSLTIKVQAKLESELNASTSREEYLKATIEALKEEKASAEALMTEKIDLLEKENSALRHKHSNDVNTLEDEVEFASIAKSHVDAQLQFALYDLDRTGRLLNRRDDDLADQDEIIARILAEKEILHKDATHLSKQLESKDTELSSTVKVQAKLESELNASTSREEYLKATIEALKEEKASAEALMTEKIDLLEKENIALRHKHSNDVNTLEDEVEFASIAKSHVDAQLQFALYDLDRTGRLLNRRDDDLADQDEIIARILAEKEILHKDATHLSKQLESKDAELSLTIKVQAKLESELNASTSREEYLKATIEALKEEKASGETLMTEKIDLLEKENIAFREQSNINPPPAPSSSVYNLSWESTPIKVVDEGLRDTTFGADDTFDESMFLPNVDCDAVIPQTADNSSPINPPPKEEKVFSSPRSIEMSAQKAQTPAVDDEADIPQTADSSTPLKTLSKEERVLSSPRNIEKSAKKAQTPAKRLTRAMKNKLRTPLGKSAIQNTPLSTSMSTRKFTRTSSRKNHTKI